MGVYSKRNLCFRAGFSTTLICLNVDFSMPRLLTKSMLDPTIPSDSLLMTMSGVGLHRNPPISTWYCSPVAGLDGPWTEYWACAGTAATPAIRHQTDIAAA